MIKWVRTSKLLIKNSLSGMTLEGLCVAQVCIFFFFFITLKPKVE